MKYSFQFLLFLLAFAFGIEGAYAKKVKFSVDMSAQTVSPHGVYVNGDFQTLLGLPNNDTIAIRLQQEGATSIYSTVLTLPAFRKYEYKFLNGDQFYEAEFVPEPSRVGHDFNDNRWIYVDSIAADTFSMGAIRFGENAPAGLNMIRFLVEMDFVNPTQPVHVAANFTNWNFARNTLFRFDAQLYEIILFAPAGNYEYAFSHGATTNDAETIAGGCANQNGRRTLSLLGDTILNPVCFGMCMPCVLSNQSLAEKAFQPMVFPNPATTGQVTIEPNGGIYNLLVFNASGQNLDGFPEKIEGNQHLSLPAAGLYLIQLRPTTQDGQIKTFKVFVP